MLSRSGKVSYLTASPGSMPTPWAGWICLSAARERDLTAHRAEEATATSRASQQADPPPRGHGDPRGDIRSQRLCATGLQTSLTRYCVLQVVCLVGGQWCRRPARRALSIALVVYGIKLRYALLRAPLRVRSAFRNGPFLYSIDS